MGSTPVGRAILLFIIFGKWLSLVEHLVWDQGVAGSNPVFPTTKTYGDIAQLGERLPCTQEVRGSIPLVSTNVTIGEVQIRNNRKVDL